MADLHNPYAPPTADEVFQVTSEGFTYQPSDGLAAGLRALLGTSVAVLLINVAVMSSQLDLLQRATRGTITIAEAEANDQRVLGVTVVWILALLATGIVWCIWQNRTSKNARALGATSMQFGPNAWGWFFCPIINLWRPVAVITELWTATLPDADSGNEGTAGWRGIAAPNWLLGGWWLPWILGGMLSRVASTFAKEIDDIGSLITSTQLQMVADCLFAVSGAFAIVMIGMLQRRVRARGAHHRR